MLYFFFEAGGGAFELDEVEGEFAGEVLEGSEGAEVVAVRDATGGEVDVGAGVDALEVGHGAEEDDLGGSELGFEEVGGLVGELLALVLAGEFFGLALLFAFLVGDAILAELFWGDGGGHGWAGRCHLFLLYGRRAVD